MFKNISRSLMVWAVLMALVLAPVAPVFAEVAPADESAPEVVVAENESNSDAISDGDADVVNEAGADLADSDANTNDEATNDAVVEATQETIDVVMVAGEGIAETKTTETVIAADVLGPIAMTIDEPNGENLTIGDAYQISWTSESESNQVTLADYHNHTIALVNNETNDVYVIIAANDTIGWSDNSFNWTVGEIMAGGILVEPGEYRIRVRYTGPVNESAGLPQTLVDETSTTIIVGDANTAPTVTVDKPTDGETLRRESSYNIIWHTDNLVTADMYNVGIALVQTDGTAIAFIASNTTVAVTDTNYNWSIPTEFISSLDNTPITNGQYRVKICYTPIDEEADKICDVSGVFNLDNKDDGSNTAPTVTVDKPTDGETLRRESSYNIIWHTDNLVTADMYNVGIALVQTDGTAIAFIASNTTVAVTDTNYNWSIPTEFISSLDNTPITNGQYRVKICYTPIDEEADKICDVSGVFNLADKEKDNNGGGGGGSRSKKKATTTEEVLPFTCSPYLTEFIKFGANNNPAEVTKLQTFLADYEKMDVPVSGVYDLKTFEAVKAFQLKYASDILEPWGVNEATGYVFITTVLKINLLKCESDEKINLDLRNYYPNPGAPGQEIGAVVPDVNDDNFAGATTSTSSVAVATDTIATSTNIFYLAAAGVFDFLSIYPWWWWLLVIALIAVISWLLKKSDDDDTTVDGGQVDPAKEFTAL